MASPAGGLGALGSVGSVGSVGGLGALATAPAWATPRVAPRAESPAVGVDHALVDSGLTARWGQAMRRDLGWAARWTPLPSGVLLKVLAAGDIDMGIHLSQPLADRWAKEGMIHDRHVLGRTDVLLLGPAQDTAGIRGETDPARVLRQVLAADAAGAARWQAPPVDSALAAWLASLGALAPPRATSAPAPQAEQLPYRLITRAEWLAEQARPSPRQAGPGPRIWLQGSASAPRALSLACEVARPFRVRHPGARLLAQWLQGPLGRQAVRAMAPAWQAAQG